MTPTKGLNLHIYPAPILSESRIFRQTLAVARASLFDEIEICGTPAHGLPQTEPLSEGRTIRRIGADMKRTGSVVARVRYQVAWSFHVYRTYASSDLRIVNAHSVAVLPVAAMLARRTGAKLIYDTHELETETSTSHGLQGQVFRLAERLLIRKSSAVFVVNDMIKEWYETTYRGLRTISIVNAPDQRAAGAAHDLRAVFAIPPTDRLFVHVGNIVRARYIVEIIEAFAGRPSDHVVFLGDGDLGRVVDDAAATLPNVHHHPSVDSDSVTATLSTADVGICLIEPTCLSYELALPNKAIEYASAGLPFIHNDLPSVRRLLAEGLTSFLVKDVQGELSRVLDGLSEQVISAGRAEISEVRLPKWGEESGKMLDVYGTLIAAKTRRGGRA
ncbi:glycosyltransferase [Microbacterium sp. OR21]|uniref:glycosyltransferase n=1 Tax=Microbacterium sp. OR21 TaxID=3095346 RepID=UPI0039B6AB1A